MSYCRCGPDSDVYVYHSMSGGWDIYVANDVSVQVADDYHEHTRARTLRRLLKLREAGLKVPDTALERLKREIVLYKRAK